MRIEFCNRIIAVLLCIFFCTGLSFSQETDNLNNDRAIGITFSSLGENEIIRFEELDGGASYDGDGFFSIGINYLQSINKWITLETGVEYAQHTVCIYPQTLPDIHVESRSVDMVLITFPISIRAYLSQYFFVNTGLLVDIDITNESEMDSQSGIGGLLGIGANYDFDSGVSVFINPYLKLHSLMPFSSEDYHQRLLEAGFRIGVAYQLK
jgi:hypothetical protein